MVRNIDNITISNTDSEDKILKKIILPYRSLFDIYLVFVFIEYMHVYSMSFYYQKYS